MRACVRVCVCVCVCMCVCVHTHTHIHTYIHVYTSHTHTHMCVCVCVCIYMQEHRRSTSGCGGTFFSSWVTACMLLTGARYVRWMDGNTHTHTQFPDFWSVFLVGFVCISLFRVSCTACRQTKRFLYLVLTFQGYSVLSPTHRLCACVCLCVRVCLCVCVRCTHWRTTGVFSPIELCAQPIHGDNP